MEVSTLSSVIAKYRAIYNTLKDISVESSNAEARMKAESFLKLILSYTFIVALIVAQFVLSFSHPLCLALQKKTVTSSKPITMPNVARQPYLRNETKASSLNYERKLKLLLQRLRLNSVNLEPLVTAYIGVMQLQIQQMLRVITE